MMVNFAPELRSLMTLNLTFVLGVKTELRVTDFVCLSVLLKLFNLQ